VSDSRKRLSPPALPAGPQLPLERRAAIETARGDRRLFLLIYEAGIIDARQLSRVLDQAQGAGAKVILLGDPDQLPATSIAGCSICIPALTAAQARFITVMIEESHSEEFGGEYVAVPWSLPGHSLDSRWPLLSSKCLILLESTIWIEPTTC
jgi:hypothetical protein